jgi:hypothetical protein
MENTDRLIKIIESLPEQQSAAQQSAAQQSAASSPQSTTQPTAQPTTQARRPATAGQSLRPSHSSQPSRLKEYDGEIGIFDIIQNKNINEYDNMIFYDNNHNILGVLIPPIVITESGMYTKHHLCFENDTLITQGNVIIKSNLITSRTIYTNYNLYYKFKPADYIPKKLHMKYISTNDLEKYISTKIDFYYILPDDKMHAVYLGRYNGNVVERDEQYKPSTAFKFDHHKIYVGIGEPAKQLYYYEN